MASLLFLVRLRPFDLQGYQNKAGSPARGQSGSLLEASLACVQCWPGLGGSQAYVWGLGGFCCPLPTPRHLIRLSGGCSPAFSLPALLHQSQPVFADVCAVTFLSCLPRGRILARAGGLWDSTAVAHLPGDLQARVCHFPWVILEASGKSVPWASCVRTLAFLGFAILRGWGRPSQGLGSLTVASPLPLPRGFLWGQLPGKHHPWPFLQLKGGSVSPVPWAGMAPGRAHTAPLCCAFHAALVATSGPWARSLPAPFLGARGRGWGGLCWHRLGRGGSCSCGWLCS